MATSDEGFDRHYLTPGSGSDYCLMINVYDYATQVVESVDDDGFKWIDWDRSTEIGLPAPAEIQPEWDSVNCEDFIIKRMEGIKRINKMKNPRIMPDDPFGESSPADMNWPWDHVCLPLEEIIGYQPSMRRMVAWTKLRKTDEILWDYYLTKGKGVEPKLWHDTYLEYLTGEDLDWYSDLPGYDTFGGVYMGDGVSFTASSPVERWQSLTNPTYDEEGW